MNLSAWFAAHQKPALAGGAVGGVALLALLSRRKKAAAAAAPPAGYNVAGGTGANIAGVAAPNTAATDSANGFQDQLNSLQNQISTATATPAPLTTAAPGSAGYGYVRNVVDQAVYSVDKATGTAHHLTPQEYAAAGMPAYVNYYDPATSLIPAKTPITIAPESPSAAPYVPAAKIPATGAPAAATYAGQLGP